MELTEEESGYDIDALKEGINSFRQNKVIYQKIVYDPRSSKDDVITFMERVEMEDAKILKYQRIIDELKHRNGDKKE